MFIIPDYKVEEVINYYGVGVSVGLSSEPAIVGVAVGSPLLAGVAVGEAIMIT
jgi:hypothetical protein